MKLFVSQQLKSLLKRMGYELRNIKPNPEVDFQGVDAYVLEPFLKKSDELLRYKKGSEQTGMGWTDDFLKACRFLSLQEVIKHCVRTFPDKHFAECGCWKGHSTWVTASLMKEGGSKSQFHVFDSFEGGLSDKVAEDESLRGRIDANQVAKEKLVFASEESEVKENLSEFDFVKFYKGWIPERFPEVKDFSFGFVHLDVDLYQPTRDGLEFFFPRLEKGGAIVIDDYNFSQFPGARKAVDQFLIDKPQVFFYAVPTGGAFLIK
jgi:O-methyltransferase